MSWGDQSGQSCRPTDWWARGTRHLTLNLVPVDQTAILTGLRRLEYRVWSQIPIWTRINRVKRSKSGHFPISAPWSRQCVTNFERSKIINSSKNKSSSQLQHAKKLGRESVSSGNYCQNDFWKLNVRTARFQYWNVFLLTTSEHNPTLRKSTVHCDY